MRSPQAPKWIAAMEEEKKAFFDSGTWEVVDTDPAWNLLSSKWVFKIKKDEHGNISLPSQASGSWIPAARRSRLWRHFLPSGLLQHSSHGVGTRCALRPLEETPGLTQGIHAGRPGHSMLYEAPSRYEATRRQVSPAPQIHLRAQAGQQTLQPSASHILSTDGVHCVCLMYHTRSDQLVLVAIYVDDILMCSTRKRSPMRSPPS